MPPVDVKVYYLEMLEHFRRDVAPSEIAASIDATSNDEIVELAGRLFRPDCTAVALLGNFDGSRPDESILS